MFRHFAKSIMLSLCSYKLPVAKTTATVFYIIPSNFDVYVRYLNYILQKNKGGNYGGCYFNCIK